MPIVRILPHRDYCPDGATLTAEAGVTVCDAMLAGGVEIDHACEKSCACTTCHVVVREGYASLGEASEVEDDLLDRAWGLSPTSRLSCQAVLGDTDVTVEIPLYNLNHAREASH